MAQVEIMPALLAEIHKKFKGESVTILEHLKSLEQSLTKGKRIGVVQGLLIKELKYKSFRFYFVTDNNKLVFYNKGELVDILLRFVRMTNKKRQQETIKEIKTILLKIGPYGFT